MSNKGKKNLVAALLVAAVVVTAAPSLAAGQGRRSEERAGASWVVRVLGWLGIQPGGLRSVMAETSANIDPNGQPQGGGENPQGAASPDDSANIDPDG